MDQQIGKIKFLGATGTVTGSKSFISVGPDLEDRFLVDAGLFQGPKPLRLRNWSSLPVDPVSIGAILITHAHIDHCGYLPRLVQQGFSGPVYCGTATADLMEILLLDSAHLQEEEANYANKRGYSKHSPALPLYTTEDAQNALDLLRPVKLHSPIKIGKYTTATFFEAGHIMGSTMIHLDFNKNGISKSILFSGDIGRFGMPILPDPETPATPDMLIMESTYGDRFHPETSIRADLADIVNRSIERKGVLLIPAFAVGRTQLLMYLLKELQSTKEIPEIPIYLDSPMAIRTVQTYMAHTELMDTETRYLQSTGANPCRPNNLHMCISVDDSKALNQIQNQAIIISASGMATGGRILHHLKVRLPERNNTVLFSGYQAVGTRGRTIMEGHDTVKIHGIQVPIRCHMENAGGFSAHADRDELLGWLSKFESIPQKIFINHGEEEASESLAKIILEKFSVQPEIPQYESEFPF